ncbi:V-set domain containing T-cell activation inhibitor 1-like [Discoglossus pictus]
MEPGVGPVFMLFILELIAGAAAKMCPNLKDNVVVSSYTNQLVKLPCTFSWPGGHLTEKIVVWQKQTEDTELVVDYLNGEDEYGKKDEAFIGRTSINKEWFKHSDASLTLQGVTASDVGVYRCYIMGYPLHAHTHLCCEVTLEVERDTWSIPSCLCIYLGIALVTCLVAGNREIWRRHRVTIIIAGVPIAVATIVLFHGTLTSKKNES